MAVIAEVQFERAIRTIESRAKAAVAKAAYDAQGIAQGRVNVDTGTLKNSIGVDFENGGLSATIGTGVSYAAPQEFGWVNSPGKPYLRPAYEQVRGPLLNAMKRVAN